ncbi:MAG TPA: hypothetical protein VGN63_14060 [Flavisolibacter sp.]|jgi:hypothetical protein|nr:hypothetical protein [Flavisolibacter sp.]
MKKLGIQLLLVVFSLAAWGQQTVPPPQQLASDYLQKSRVQRTSAFVLIGGGAILSLAGLGQAVNHMFDDKPAGGALMLIGLGMMVGSIPLFISAGKNKDRAAAMTGSLRMQQAPVLEPARWRQVAYPSIVVSVPL